MEGGVPGYDVVEAVTRPIQELLEPVSRKHRQGPQRIPLLAENMDPCNAERRDDAAGDRRRLERSGVPNSARRCAAATLPGRAGPDRRLGEGEATSRLDEPYRVVAAHKGEAA